MNNYLINFIISLTSLLSFFYVVYSLGFVIASCIYSFSHDDTKIKSILLRRLLNIKNNFLKFFIIIIIVIFSPIFPILYFLELILKKVKQYWYLLFYKNIIVWKENDNKMIYKLSLFNQNKIIKKINNEFSSLNLKNNDYQKYFVIINKKDIKRIKDKVKNKKDFMSFILKSIQDKQLLCIDDLIISNKNKKQFINDESNKNDLKIVKDVLNI